MTTNWLVVLKTYVDTLETIVGTEGGVALANKLTAARATLLDQITALRMAELDPANVPADVDTLKAAIGAIEGATALHNKLTAARAAFLDIAISSRAPGATALTNVTWTDALATALSAYTAAKAAFIDIAISSRAPSATALTNVTWTDAIATALASYTAARAGYLDELAAANIPTDVNAVGLRADAAVIVVSAIDSIVAYVKGILNQVNSLIPLTAITVAGRLQEKATTIDLNQVVATYDLLTGTAQVVILESLVIQMPVGAAGGALTSISIQTNDATPAVIIPAAVCPVAALTSEAQFYWTGKIRVAVGKKIQLTIAGGATGAAYVCSVVAETRAVVSGGYFV